MAQSNLKISCLSIDCPERHGDACQFDLDGTRNNLIRDLTKVHPMSKGEARSRIKKLIASELRQVRAQYDALEFVQEESDSDNWRQWKQVRNVLTDRIEQITGSRR